LQSDKAEDASEELEARKRKAQALIKLKEDTEAQLAELEKHLEALKGRAADSAGGYRLVRGEAKVRGRSGREGKHQCPTATHGTRSTTLLYFTVVRSQL